MERLLNEAVIKQVRQAFEQMQEPVALLFFGTQERCDYCAEILQLLNELAETSDKLSVSEFDLQQHAEQAATFKVDKAPMIVVAARNGGQIENTGVQYAGMPSGHEFGVLINDILLVSARQPGLSEAVQEFLKQLEKPLHLQVFVTPT